MDAYADMARTGLHAEAALVRPAENIVYKSEIELAKETTIPISSSTLAPKPQLAPVASQELSKPKQTLEPTFSKPIEVDRLDPIHEITEQTEASVAAPIKHTEDTVVLIPELPTPSMELPAVESPFIYDDRPYEATSSTELEDAQPRPEVVIAIERIFEEADADIPIDLQIEHLFEEADIEITDDAAESIQTLTAITESIRSIQEHEEAIPPALIAEFTEHLVKVLNALEQPITQQAIIRIVRHIVGAESLEAYLPYITEALLNSQGTHEHKRWTLRTLQATTEKLSGLQLIGRIALGVRQTA